MTKIRTCPIWETRACINYSSSGGTFVDSPRAGGNYYVTKKVGLLMPPINERQKALLTTWLIDQRRMGEQCPKIELTTIKDMKQWQDLPVRERADRLLRYFRQLELDVGADFIWSENYDDSKTLSALAWIESKNISPTPDSDAPQKEIIFFCKYLETKGWITKSSPREYRLTVEGYAHLEELEHKVVVSSQVFIAMWFDKSMEDAWKEGIKPAIKDSGYRPFRIDQKDHLNKIDDEIIAEIRRSRFIVADFTHGDNGPRGGVYYEAGFAHGLNIPVIFTCRKDELENVHFDTRQYNHIVWETPEELRNMLVKRIGAVIGDGPLKDNNPR